MGYFPNSLWSGRFTQSAQVQWFGEVYSTHNPPCSQMGNGVFPAQLGAAMTSLLYPVSTVYPVLYANPDAPTNLYDVSLISHGFYYGGPGGGC